MLDRNQLKNAGLRYARSLQLLFKTASVFSGTHTAINVPLQNSFDQLNELVKQLRQFTVGFVDQRVMLNNILTAEKSLASLENEFLKRGIGAVTFEAGITVAAYKRFILVTSVQAKDIEAQGGISNYLSQNPLEFVRIFPASKTQQRNDSGDTILEMDSESFLMAKAMNEIRNPSLDRIDWFLQQSGISGQGAAPGGGAPGAGPGGGVGEGSGAGDGTGGGSGSGTGFGPGGGSPGTGPAGTSFGPMVTPPQPISAGGPAGITSIVENYLSSSVMDSEESPQRSYVELARIIQDTRPEFVLQNFSPQRREELRKLPPEQMAAEVIEDTAVKWAVDRLVNAPSGGEAVIVEEEVIRVLLRSLQATQMASRLARKLAEHVKEFQIPQTTYARIQEELAWIVVPGKEKFERLMAIEHYNRFEFRRLISFLSDLAKAGEREQIEALANHYFAILDQANAPEAEELSRIPELVRTIAGLQSTFWTTSAKRLSDALARWGDQQFVHIQVINAIAAVSANLAIYEEFDLVESLGTTLEQNAAQNPAQHANCCGAAVGRLLSTHALDRIIEIYVQKQKGEDRNWGRIAGSLLRRSGTPGITKVFLQLEDEPVASTRLALLRLIGRIGAPAVELARERLNDARWYVVRNSCKLLGDLKDPNLLDYIGVALRHTDERVQKTAVTAVLDSRHPNRAKVLADALPFLHPHVAEDVFGELMFVRDPACVPALEQMIFRESRPAQTILTCVQTTAVIPGEQADTLLARVVAEPAFDTTLRRTALQALVRRGSAYTSKELRKFISTSPNDPLAVEANRAFASAGSK